MGERHSEYERDDHDWYVEETWNVARLFERVPFDGRIHDPCCGMGTIVKEAMRRGFKASGSDIADRGYQFAVGDFFGSTTKHDNIVTNPPYKIALSVIEHALRLARRRVAVLTQIKFLAGQKRYPLFTDPRMEKVIVFSRRPNMPPGKMLREHGESIRGGGSIDYCWLVWDNTAKDKKAVAMEWAI